MQKSLRMILFLLLSFTVCADLQKIAYRNPVDNPCSDFGFIAPASIPAKAVFLNPVDQEEHVVLKNYKDEIDTTKVNLLTTAVSLKTKEELTDFLREYSRICGTKSLPTDFTKIEFVDSYLKKENETLKNEKISILSKIKQEASPKEQEQLLFEGAYSGNLPLVEKLLESGVSKASTNESGKKPLDMAKEGAISPENYAIGRLLTKEVLVDNETVTYSIDKFGNKKNFESIIQLLSSPDTVSKREESPKEEPLQELKIVKSGCDNKSTVSSGTENGRFTMGVDGKSLLFGYPIMLSTSHFIVRVDSKFASNHDGYGCGAVPVSGVSIDNAGKESGEAYKSYRFHFNGVEIRQHITPEAQVLEGSESQDRRVKKYSFEFTLSNNTDKVKYVSLYYLLDIMLGSNDSPEIWIKDSMYRKELALKKAKVPQEIIFKEDTGLGSTIHFPEEGFDKPDSLYISDWNYLVTVLGKVYITKKQLQDTAAMMRWLSRKLEPGQTVRFGFSYGLSANQPDELSIIYSQPASKRIIELNYKTGGYILNKKKKKLLQSLVGSESLQNIKGILVEGHTDIVGDPKFNFSLSQKRAQVIKGYLEKLGIHPSKIFIKALGETVAQQKKQKKASNYKDRRVTVKIYK
jgi:outer membrane protein OmpA-like peptidoglycan-associated protein